MSPVEACKGCGGLFPFLPRGICADCIDLREQRYTEVREWLLDNRGASLLQAVQETGIEESLIMEFIREGRLEFVGSATTSPAEEDLKERIRQDLAARAAEAAATQAPFRPGAGTPVSRGMRSRGQ